MPGRSIGLALKHMPISVMIADTAAACHGSVVTTNDVYGRPAAIPAYMQPLLPTTMLVRLMYCDTDTNTDTDTTMMITRADRHIMTTAQQ